VRPQRQAAIPGGWSPATVGVAGLRHARRRTVVPCAVGALQGLRHGELESSLARKSPERDRLSIIHLAYRDTNNS